MARGGKRAGAGRKPTSPTVRTREAAEKAFERGDRMPMDVMLDMMNGRIPFDKDLLAIAQAAAPYLHPRLSAVEAKVDVGLTDVSDDELDSLIEAAAAEIGFTPGAEGEGQAEE